MVFMNTSWVRQKGKKEIVTVIIQLRNKKVKRKSYIFGKKFCELQNSKKNRYFSEIYGGSIDFAWGKDYNRERAGSFVRERL